MTYGLSRRDFIENGPADMALQARSANKTARHWHALNPSRRLALIERAMTPANDVGIDGFPMAL